MRVLITVLLVLASTISQAGCGRPPGTWVGFEEYVDMFVAEGKARGVEVEMFWVDIKLVDSFPSGTEIGTIGLCDLNTGHVTIYRKYWENNPREREELIFHELGHCALSKEHSSCPNVMCPNVIGSDVYLPKRKQFLDVLFAH
jgi:hypothetical protein